MSERIRLIFVVIAVSLVGIVAGLFFGGNLSPHQQYRERTTKTVTKTVVSQSHDDIPLHKHVVTTVVAVTETTPHSDFHDFASRIVSGATATLTVSIPASTTNEMWTVIEAGTPQGIVSARRANEIWLGNTEFNPGAITVPAGTKVTWVNKDAELHTVTSNDGLFNGSVLPGGSFSYTFTEPGTFSYYCQPHSGMAGTVIVR